MNPLNHVAIIMDGNGRWGLKHKNSRNFGHKAGLKVVEKIIKFSIQKKLRYLTLFAFSTENWKRPKNEINFLFKLLDEFLKQKIDELNKNQVKLKFIGNITFNKKLKKLLILSEKITSKNSKLQVNLAINYGSKDELINSFRILKKKILKLMRKIFQKIFIQKIYPIQIY